jgi:hypothetical protein
VIPGHRAFPRRPPAGSDWAALASLAQAFPRPGRVAQWLLSPPRASHSLQRSHPRDGDSSSRLSPNLVALRRLLALVRPFIIGPVHVDSTLPLSSVYTVAPRVVLLGYHRRGRAQGPRSGSTARLMTTNCCAHGKQLSSRRQGWSTATTGTRAGDSRPARLARRRTPD